MLDQLLEKVGLKYEELNPVEKETLFTWNEALKKNQITVEKIKDYIHAMRDAVEDKLAVSTLNKVDDTYLKARLRNYMLLEAFLTSPEKAQKAIDAQIQGLIKK